jgi:hypothetical protein
MTASSPGPLSIFISSEAEGLGREDMDSKPMLRISELSGVQDGSLEIA